MATWRMRAAAVVLCGATGALVGCFDDAPAAPELTAADEAGFRSLAQVWELGNEVNRAEDELIRRCMVAKGSKWRGGYHAEDYVYSPYRGLTVEIAAEYGYSMLGFSTPESRAFDQADEAEELAMTEAERAKRDVDLHGGPGDTRTVVLDNGGEITYPAGGCRRHAKEQLYEDPDEAFLRWEALNGFGPDWDEVMASREARDVTKRWSECMAAVNLVYAEPGDASYEASEAAETPTFDEEGNQIDSVRRPPDQKEIATAVADATCRAETGYDETIGTLLKAAYGREAIALEGDILALMEVYTKAQERARELLG